jgi:hypothetical protein
LLCNDFKHHSLHKLKHSVILFDVFFSEKPRVVIEQVLNQAFDRLIESLIEDVSLEEKSVIVLMDQLIELLWDKLFDRVEV